MAPLRHRIERLERRRPSSASATAEPARGLVRHMAIEDRAALRAILQRFAPGRTTLTTTERTAIDTIERRARERMESAHA
ncbi:hypothetical protein [Azospirillum sp. TSO35-2]|uniref:hypothetical protein n=1 Tax=Azospirillum sp. TSO35-2 TaxID=716796 RepID=UPI0011B763DC|nr:hypothetical protein [Azospirillum sp. TSO35-2]